MDQGIWKESEWEDVNKEDVGSCNRFKEGICAEERGSLSIVQRRERRSEEVYLGADEEGIYLTIKFTIDCTSILCRKEEWKEENGTRLSVSK